MKTLIKEFGICMIISTGITAGIVVLTFIFGWGIFVLYNL